MNVFGIPIETVVTVITAVGSWYMKKKAQDAADLAEERKFWIQSHSAISSYQDAAAKRSSPWVRKFAAVFIIVVCFGGLLAMAFARIPVSQIVDVPQKSFLFGLFKWGETVKVLQATGFVLPDWVRFSVCTVVGFLFGSGLAKTK